MSCYEWEHGTIRLPTKIFAKFRREFIDKYNAVQEEHMSTLNRYRDNALRVGKKSRLFNFKRHMEDQCQSWGEQSFVHMLFPDDRRKPLKPTKKMFNFVNGKDIRFEVGGGDGHIYFDKKEHIVAWSVEENNHAVDDARGSKEGKIFFGMLNRVTWTRGSGGVIVGNNEYNRDDHYEGGGGNYVTATYGNRK